MGIVLLSGGWESAYCLCVSGEKRCLFIDYGQPYVRQELAAVRAMRDRLGLQIVQFESPALHCANGVFDNRNQKLIEQASHCSDEVWFGCRGLHPWFDHYGDSNLIWARRLQKRLGIRIITPCIMLPKWAIKQRVRHFGLADLIWSSEGYDYDHGN